MTHKWHEQQTYFATRPHENSNGNHKAIEGETVAKRYI